MSDGRSNGAGVGSLPVSEALCGRILALPFHAYLEESAQARIVDTLLGTLARAA